ncbi:MAG TPA: FkbM family methyltransferase [Bacteroidales bacterium]|nr:FkbM family methyltransferase [Bacteroidales bacterium]
MKQRVKLLLQRLLGFDNYLFLFAIYIITTLRWNKNERDFIHFVGLIPDGHTVLDIGANIGIMSVWFSRKLRTSRILAFEPVPQNVKALRKVLRFYKADNVEVIEKALGNEQGIAEMILPEVEMVKMQGLSHVVHSSITDFNEGENIKVPMIKLDDCEHLHATECISAIKLDVENFEYFVLAGAQKTIEKHRPLIYAELWENDNRHRCFDLLKSFDYCVCILEKGKLVEFDHHVHNTQNFFFLPNTHHTTR